MCIFAEFLKMFWSVCYKNILEMLMIDKEPHAGKKATQLNLC